LCIWKICNLSFMREENGENNIHNGEMGPVKQARTRNDLPLCCLRNQLVTVIRPIPQIKALRSLYASITAMITIRGYRPTFVQKS
jgi:hypothetical protein